MDTTALLASAQNGDSDAIKKLLLPHNGMIAAVVTKFVWDRDAVEDVIQNVFLKAIAHLGQFKNTCRFSTWLYRIAVNECFDAVRSRLKSRQMFLESDHLESLCDLNAPDGLSLLSDKQISDSIAQAVNSLPLDQKTAFSLFYFAGYSGTEIAMALNISEDNAFMKVKAARDHVKKLLKKAGWAP